MGYRCHLLTVSSGRKESEVALFLLRRGMNPISLAADHLPSNTCPLEVRASTYTLGDWEPSPWQEPSPFPGGKGGERWLERWEEVQEAEGGRAGSRSARGKTSPRR